MDRFSTTQLINKINKLIMEKDFNQLDSFILQVDLSKDPLELLSYVRASFKAKDKLKNWLSVRDQVFLEFKKINLDAKSIMTGIY